MSLCFKVFNLGQPSFIDLFIFFFGLGLCYATLTVQYPPGIVVVVGLSQVPDMRWFQTFSLKLAPHTPLLVVALLRVKMAATGHL